MSLFQNIVVLFYIGLLILSVCSFTFAKPTEITGLPNDTKNTSCFRNTKTELHQLKPLHLADMGYIDGGQTKTRAKRQSAGKFQDAASMTPTKVMQLWFSFVKNLATNDPIGGNHPMARTIPGPVVMLFKQKILSKVFPNLDADH